jgi:hypothetical protein
MKPFKIGATGWDQGCRLQIIERKKWGKTYVYKCKLSTPERRTTWIEYNSHERILKEEMFQYDSLGEYRGKYFERFSK